MHEDLDDRIRAVVGDERVVAAMRATPRNRFLDEALGDRAWIDAPLAIGDGQTISQPSLVATMCEALELRGDERVLDVGTGSGWHAAVLARLADSVVSVERHRRLLDVARTRLARMGLDVETHWTPTGLGWPAGAPYGAINVAAVADDERLLRPLAVQLAPGGRLLAPVRVGDEQRLVRWTRAVHGDRWRRRDLGPVRFVPLVVEWGDGS